jgi:hypothetical protein
MNRVALVVIAFLFAGVTRAEERPASPRGQSSAQIGAKWLDGQLLIDFVDVTPKAAKLRISWGTTVALAPIQLD